MSDTNKDTNENLKDKVKDHSSVPAPYEAEGFRSGSYIKTNKLITALYMVTDVMDTEEPIRNKLRTLGLDIISDAYVVSKIVSNIGKINQIMSFLDIALAMNFISEMNYAILKKEFLVLKESIQESRNLKPDWLGEFLKTEFPPLVTNDRRSDPYPASPLSRGRGNTYKGHTRIGVQKGSTLMKALSQVTMSDRSPLEFENSFDVLKKQRRDQIINLIKTNLNGATITDIRTKATGVLASCGEKTLQRELVSMIKDNVLYKTGEKRWTKYSVIAS